MASFDPGIVVLVVDDEEVVRVMFKDLLESEGFVVLLAETKQQGMQMMDQHLPPVVVIDKNLPDGSGLELIAIQKAKHPDTEFIMITGYSTLDAAVEAMKAGAYSYLTKPFGELDNVLKRIQAAVAVHDVRARSR